MSEKKKEVAKKTEPKKIEIKKIPKEKLGLYRKFLKIQEHLDGLEMDGENKKQNYRYLSDSKLTKEANKAMIEFGVALRPPQTKSVENYEKGTKNYQMMVTRVSIEFTFIDVDTGEFDTGLIVMDATDGGDKAVSKAMTNARKYLFRLTFNVGSNDDADEHSPELENRNKRQQQPPKQARPPKQQPPPQKTPLDIVKQDVSNILGSFGLTSANKKAWVDKITANSKFTVNQWADTKANLNGMKNTHRWNAIINDFTPINVEPQPPVQSPPPAQPPVQQSGHPQAQGFHQPPVTQEVAPPVQQTPPPVMQGQTPNNDKEILQAKIFVDELFEGFGLAQPERNKYLLRFNAQSLQEWNGIHEMLKAKMGAGEVWNTTKEDFESQ